MNTKWKAVIIGGAMLAGLSGTATARHNVGFSVSLGVPAYTYAPPPAYPYYGYYAPEPVIYYRPRPPRVYYAPARAYYYGGPRHWHGHRHHRRR